LVSLSGEAWSTVALDGEACIAETESAFKQSKVAKQPKFHALFKGLPSNLSIFQVLQSELKVL